MTSDDLVTDKKETDRVGDVEMNQIQSQRRVVIPEGFAATLDFEVGEKVVVKCEEDCIKIKKASDAL